MSKKTTKIPTAGDPAAVPAKVSARARRTPAPVVAAPIAAAPVADAAAAAETPAAAAAVAAPSAAFEETAREAAETASTAVALAAEPVVVDAPEPEVLSADSSDAVTPEPTAAKSVAASVTLIFDPSRSVNAALATLVPGLQGLGLAGRQNLDTVAGSARVAAAALKEIGQEVSTYTRTAHEERLAALRAVSGARTLPELFERQASFAQNAFAGWTRQASRIGAIWATAAREMAAPLGRSDVSVPEQSGDAAR